MIRCKRKGTGRYPCDNWSCEMCRLEKIRKLREKMAVCSQYYANCLFITISPEPIVYDWNDAETGSHGQVSVRELWGKLKELRSYLSDVNGLARMWAFIEKGNQYHAHIFCCVENGFLWRLNKADRKINGHSVAEFVIAKILNCIVYGYLCDMDSVDYVTKYLVKDMQLSNGRLKYFQYCRPGVVKIEKKLSFTERIGEYAIS